MELLEQLTSRVQRYSNLAYVTLPQTYQLSGHCW